MAALTQMSHVCKVVSPQDWTGKSMESELGEIEAENLDFKKIGLKIIKEAEKKDTRVAGPQNWKFKNTKAEIEAEDLNKIGLKIIKETGKEGYPVTAKMTVTSLEISNHIPYEQYGL
uniref:Uncharacterized protein n=1 Tax=Acrobeloides nanus TaxID=290746 RepID=A0A914D3I2_9BILA